MLGIRWVTSDNFPTFFGVTKIFDYSDTRFSNLAIEYRCENEQKCEIVLACHKGPIGLGKRNSTFLLLYYVARIEYNLFGQLNNKLIWNCFCQTFVYFPAVLLLMWIPCYDVLLYSHRKPILYKISFFVQFFSYLCPSLNYFTVFEL